MRYEKGRITSRLLPLTNDLVFKAVYGSNTEASNAALIALLNRLLEKEDDPIVWLRCENPFSYRTHSKEKEIIMDIKVRLSSGELVDLEMQVHHLSEYVNRSIYYMGKLVNESLEIGEDYDKMRKSIVISIVDGVLFPKIEKAFNSYYFKEVDVHHKLTDLAQIHFLELGKIDVTSKPISEMIPHERFLHDIATIKERARKDGLAEGLAEGRTEGRETGDMLRLIRMVCKKLLKGKSTEVIADELEEEISVIEPICKIAERFAPEYDVEKIHRVLMEK